MKQINQSVAVFTDWSYLSAMNLINWPIGVCVASAQNHEEYTSKTSAILLFISHVAGNAALFRYSFFVEGLTACPLF